MIVVSTLGSDILFARFPTVELMVSQRKLSMAITSRSTVIQKGCLLKLLWIISGGIRYWILQRLSGTYVCLDTGYWILDTGDGMMAT